jgi:hypothetical protein
MKSAGNPGLQRGRPGHKLQIALVVCGVLAGFAVTLGAVTAFRNNHHAAVSSPSPLPPAYTAPAVPAVGDDPSPGALDAEWSGYSDRSTCADWAGGDGVSAVRLSATQIAWFFSDTYLGPAGSAIGFSHSSAFVHNSLVMQTTTGPRSRFVTLTGGGACTGPGRSSAEAAPLISIDAASGQQDDKYWDADGIADGGYVDRFYIRYLPGGPPYIPVGTTIARFAVSQLSAAGRGSAFGATARPLVTTLPAYTPPDGGTPIVWGAALLRTQGTVYVYGWQSSDASVPVRQLYLARVAASRLTDFPAWTFYAGGGQWTASQASAQPVQPNGMDLPVSAGFSVVPIAGRYWLIQSGIQAGSPDINAYPGPTPWGPFDPGSGILLYRSPDVGLDPAHDYRIMYEARAEPALSTSRTLMISYNTNSVGVSTGCYSVGHFTNAVTQPRFVAVPVAAFTAGAASLSHYRAVVGPSVYPAITQRDPSQWFSGWAQAGGCPPVPGLGNVTVRAAAGTASLAWPDAGLGVAYLVYERSPADAQYILARTVPGTDTTLSGLRRGATYQFLVVPVNVRHQTGPGSEITVRVP